MKGSQIQPSLMKNIAAQGHDVSLTAIDKRTVHEQ